MSAARLVDVGTEEFPCAVDPTAVIGLQGATSLGGTYIYLAGYGDYVRSVRPYDEVVEALR